MTRNVKVIHRKLSDAPQRRVIHIDLTDHDRPESRSLRSDLRTDLHRAERSMTSVAEDLAEATLAGIRRYRRERAQTDSDEKSLRRAPLHAARAAVVAIEAAEGSGDELERFIDDSVLRRRLRRALRR